MGWYIVVSKGNEIFSAVQDSINKTAEAFLGDHN